MARETVVLRTFHDVTTAEVARSLLESEDIPAFLDSSDLLMGPIAGVTSGVHLRVDAEDAVRARAILADTELSDRELEYLATGDLSHEEPER